MSGLEEQLRQARGEAAAAVAERDRRADVGWRTREVGLMAEAATLPGYHRIFAGSSAKWGGGGVASLVASKGAACIGSIVRLSAAELDLLDRHEGIPTGSDPFSGAPPNLLHFTSAPETCPCAVVVDGGAWKAVMLPFQALRALRRQELPKA